MGMTADCCCCWCERFSFIAFNGRDRDRQWAQTAVYYIMCYLELSCHFFDAFASLSDVISARRSAIALLSSGVVLGLESVVIICLVGLKDLFGRAVACFSN